MNKKIINNTALLIGVASISGVIVNPLISEANDKDIAIAEMNVKSQIVDMPDENLKKGINNALGRGEVLDDITIADMESLKTLIIVDKNISNIQGLQHAVNLTNLYLYDNQISDISVLENLTNLTNLQIQGNQIIDISFLSNLLKLTNLRLDGNQISDISSLENLINLTILQLHNNKITDISPLENLTNLTTLYLHTNQISDISVLENLTNLKWLGLQNNQISDISVLENLTNLTELYLHTNQISNMSVLENLINLTTLNLGGNQISNISTLENLTNLTTLYLNNNQISDISVLENLINLTTLNLGGNQISNISTLENLTNLTALYLNNNQIEDISVLENLTNLITLNLNYNNIYDITILRHLTNLTQLFLNFNNISDISSLEFLKKIYYLDIYDNNISNIEILSNLEKLQILCIKNNNIENIECLSNLKLLQTLWLNGNNITSVQPLKNLTNLTTLYLDNNQISDISYLKNLTNLTNLQIQNNQIADISALENLTKLTTLNLTNQKITKDYIFKTNTELTNININNLVKGLNNENIDTTYISNSGYYENGKLYWNNITLGQHKFISNFNQAIQINTAKTNFSGNVTYNIDVVDGESPNVDNNISINEDEFTLSATITAEDLLSEVDYLMHKGERHSLPYTFEYDAFNRENNMVEVYDTVGNITTYEVTADLLDLETLNELVVLLEANNSSIDKISYIRAIANNMSESSNKDILNEKINNLSSDMTLERQTVSSNVDIYIKSENMLLMALDTNMITFENFSGVEDMEMREAVAVKVNSSLPYQLNAYLSSEIQNANATKILDKSIFNIKENSEDEYKKFTSIGEKVVLKDNCEDGNNITHNIDLKLDSRDAHDADVYKTTIKFEVEQK